MTFQPKPDRYWLVLERAAQQPIRVDTRSLDRILFDGQKLILSIEWQISAIPVSGNAHAVVEALAPYTRSAPIRYREVYEDGQRRAELLRRGRRDVGSLSIFLGDEDVYVDGDTVRVGRRRHRITDVEPHADLDQDLAFPGGAVPASLIMLVVAATDRYEDPELLNEKLLEYESRVNTATR